MQWKLMQLGLLDQTWDSFNMIHKGKISTFGGPSDSGMTMTEGLSIYEHAEADQRLDLFFPRSSNLSVGTSKRLNPKAYFFAYRFPLDPRPDRKTLQNTQFLFRNPVNGRMVVAWLVDYGPAEWTKRVLDISEGAAVALGIQTDQEIEAVNVSEVLALFA